MSAEFVSLAVGYCLATGELRRKGVRQRPWMEIRRLETEATYLEHQVRALRRAVRQPIRVIEDMVPGRGYYDVCRVRIQSPLLERAMEVLQDGLTEEAFLVAGTRGLACLWLDRGLWQGSRGEVAFRSAAEGEAFRGALRRIAIPSAPPVGQKHLVRVGTEGMQQLATALRPYVHRSMRHALRPAARLGTQSD